MPDTPIPQVPYGACHKTGIPEHDPELTHAGPGAPMGEVMRRRWQPVCLSEELTDVPKAIRIMGEDLVAFRARLDDLDGGWLRAAE